MKRKTVSIKGEGESFAITLTQTGVDRYTVKYGIQVKENLTYAQAAKEIGYCFMHALACEGVIEPKE